MHKVGTMALATALVLAAHGAIAEPRCPGDLGGDEQVTVDEILTSVNNALNGCPVRYVDNGDGTITDNWTGLMWEKKSDDGSIHDKDDTYTWCADDDGDSECDNPGFPPDGTPFTEFLPSLNEQAFAGYDDWRLPTVAELQDIVDRSRSAPATDPIFANDSCEPGCSVTDCSCTFSAVYWASTIDTRSPSFAWGVSFFIGLVNSGSKINFNHVRAVRGGL
jgi:hypothetical protein